PGQPDPLAGLARIALQRGDAAGALGHIGAALSARPGNPPLLVLKAAALAQNGEPDAALAIYDEAIRAAPKEVKPRADKALLLQRLGEFEDAEREIRRALKRAPKAASLYRMIATTRKIAKGEPLLTEMIKLHGDKAVTGMARAELDFALAKSMADTGQHDRVFRHLDAANRAIRTAQPYDIAQRQTEVEGLIKAFEGADFSPIESAASEPTPIFVTGLPRSGTTLVEQILASHGDVTSGGERRFVLEEAYRAIGTPGRGFTPLADLSHDTLADFATRYREAMARVVPAASIVTDKSIQSHLIFGLIAKAMPDARLIVVRRDPRDLGLSIYRNLFAPRTHGYAYDQADIAAYVATFEHMVAFWRDTIPGRFTEVSYEALVAEPEPQIRALVAAAGLEWDEACLKHHEGARQVATLSIQQVRQPITTSATGGWRRYEAELAPMIEAFGREGVALP
ncbi:MAG: sulfotransferase, partial [Pseudomonadota bacterium]